MKDRLNLLKFIQEIKEMSYQELKDLRDVTTHEDKLKLINLELSRRHYASN